MNHAPLATFTLLLAMMTIMMMSCVESSGPRANSEAGYLFIDLEGPLAAGWNAELWILGPATGGRHCEADLGCFPDHHALEDLEVTSSDDSVAEVLEITHEELNGVPAVRITLDSHSPGEARLQFRFAVADGFTPPEEDLDAEDRLADAFSIEVREVAHLRLSRYLEGLNLTSPHSACPQRGPGTYLMEYLEEYDVLLSFQKVDAGGTPLRGSGQLPLTVDPEDAATLADFEPSLDLIRMSLQTFGTLTISPDGGGDEIIGHVLAPGDVTEIFARGFALDTEGRRGLEVGQFRADRLYEVQVEPDNLPAPLCGGQIATQVQTLTPAICDVLGTIEERRTALVAAYVTGECYLRLHAPAAGGGQGLTRDLVIEVIPGFD